MELREIVGTHDPDKTQLRRAATQEIDSVDSIAGSNDGFETADVDARIVGDALRGLRPLGERTQAVVVLQRIARRQEPPDAIELQPLECELRCDI